MTKEFADKTVKDLKRLWTVKIGNWFFSSEERTREWRKYTSECKSKGLTPSEAYTILWNLKA